MNINELIIFFGRLLEAFLGSVIACLDWVYAGIFIWLCWGGYSFFIFFGEEFLGVNVWRLNLMSI